MGLVACVVLCMPRAVVAGGVGGLSGAYLRPVVGAAALGFGGAYTAAPEYYAPWWNPAALAFLREKRLSAGTGIRSFGRLDAYGSLEFPVPPRVGMGLFALYRGDPFLDKLYDVDENLLPGASYTTLTAKAAISYYISRTLSAGIALSFLHQSLPTYGSSGGIRYVTADGVGAFDAALLWHPSDALSVAAVLQNFGAVMNWQMGDFEPTVEDNPLPTMTVAAMYETVYQNKPLRCAIDIKGNVFDGTLQDLDQSQATLSAGVEWRRWDHFYLRAGIGDIAVTRDLVGNTGTYFDEYSMRVTAGFSRELTEIRTGLWFNYGIANDKLWTGVNQQVDVTAGF
jgi:hypothetical protein